jgi:hypothetical protein
MDEPSANKWVNLISPDCSGSIPATFIVSKKRGFAWFHEGQLKYRALSKKVDEALSKTAN